MDFIAVLVYKLLPESAIHNVWFVVGVLVVYAVVSEVMPFLPTKYNGPAHMLLSILGVWKDKITPERKVDTGPEQKPDVIRNPMGGE